MQSRVPPGFKFCPTEEQLVAYYLRHKLMALDPSVYTTLPDIDVCKFEPWDLLSLATSAASATNFDDSECFFFSPPDYKYAKSTRWNRTTSCGSWKFTGRERNIREQGTNNVIGIKRILVFYEGRPPRARKTNWVIHEYHDATLPLEQRNFILCKLRKKYEKKIKEKTIDFDQRLLELERELNNDTDFEYENQANFNMISKEYCSLNMSSTTQTSPQEVIDNTGTNMSSPTQTSPQEVIDNTGTQTQFLSNEDIDSMIQELSQSNEAIPQKLNSSSETPLEFDYEELYSSLVV
ncbi:NAC transcription factor 29-like [Neltuma alba]|uniref:NAC transcription factor 29-like n=1 Tax=Neltuma alba TaxID=207710 RepID=UPI0010A45FAB|nr:NAC transcription factor 29-like [Prosopis alba]